MNNKELALDLIHAGYRVIPCYPRGHVNAKAPMASEVPSWPKDAAKDDYHILKWFGGPVPKLIGLPCEINGFFAVDVDGPEAAATWQAWITNLGMSEPGPWQKTTHGAHYLFKNPAFKVPGKIGALAPGIDLRGPNYICTGGTGTGYEWQIPLTEPIPEAPEWLLSKIRALLAPATAMPELTELAGKAPDNPDAVLSYWFNKYTDEARQGTRDDCAYRLGLQLYRSRIPLGTALNLGPQYTQAIPQPSGAPYTQAEFSRAIRSAYGTMPKEAATLPREVRQDANLHLELTRTESAAKIESVKAPANVPPEAQKAPKIEGTPKIEAGAKEEPKADKTESNPALELPKVTSRPRFIVRGTEFYLADRDPIPHIVKDLVLESSVNLWFGQYGSKKTWSLLDLAVCVTSGKPWLNFEVNPCNVLIVDEESGERRLADRLGSIIKGELDGIEVPLFSVSLAQFNLRNKPEDLDELIALIVETNAKLVIIDALADVMLGGDENAVKDTQPVFAALRYASELTGASFIVIHHSNKLGGYRGSSAIAGAIDSMLLIESKPESDLITFKTEKVRDGKPMTFAGQANWTEYGFYMTASDYAVSETLTKAQRFTLDYFTENGNRTLKQLDEHAAGLYSIDLLKKAIQYFVNHNQLTRINAGTSGRIEAIYGIQNR